MKNNIEDKLEHYLRAETTEQEERELTRFFADNAPTGLEERLSRQIDGWNKVERLTERRGRTVMMRWISGVAASLLILFGLAFMTYRHTERETERALAAFSESINKGISFIDNQN
ncbi:MAG: hypothetical protein IJ197_08415 [Bacteroidaceae bacterium]|nr:hypothetical protein [Bacteroidaceae bacterium]